MVCVIVIFIKYAWVIHLTDKKGIAITSAFQKTLYESKCKPNKMWVDKGSEFYVRSMNSWLAKSTIAMHSTHNEGKSVMLKSLLEP